MKSLGIAGTVKRQLRFGTCPLIHVDEGFRFSVASNPAPFAAGVMVGQTYNAVFAPPVTIVVKAPVPQIHGFVRVGFAISKNILLPEFAARTVGLQKSLCGDRLSHEIAFSSRDA